MTATPTKSTKAASKTTKASKPVQAELPDVTQETVAAPKRVANNTMTVIILNTYTEDREGNPLPDGLTKVMAKQTASVNFGTADEPDWRRVTVPHGKNEVIYFDVWGELGDEIRALKLASKSLVLALHYELTGKTSNIKSTDTQRGDKTHTDHVFIDPALLNKRVKGYDLIYQALATTDQ